MSVLAKFDKPERAVVLIGVVSTVVALVCFGLLESTGTFENSAWSLGGAVVGWIAVAITLKRIYLHATPSSMLTAEDVGDAPFAYEEVVKVLNLRAPAVSEGFQPVSLTDYYLIRKQGNENALTFHYATWGQRIDGSCVSHPQTSHWREIEHREGELGDDPHSHGKHEYELEVAVDSLERGATFRVINSLIYFGAFDRPDREFFHTHVEKPVGQLTLVLLFADDRLATQVQGRKRVGKWETLRDVPPAERPEVFDGGKVVYWRVNKPPPGSQYQIEWVWRPAKPLVPDSPASIVEPAAPEGEAPAPR